MKELAISLQATIQRHIKPVEDELRAFAQQKYPQAIIDPGSWINQKFITVYISVLPTGNPSEESIDFMMQLTMLETAVEFRADVARSDGELILEVWDETIEYVDENEIVTQIDSVSKQASKILAAKLWELDLDKS